MIFGGKSALMPEQLKYLKNKGCKNFEVHMFYKDADESNYSRFNKLIADSGMKCYCLHSPYEDTEKLKLHLGMLTEPHQTKTTDSLKQTLILADQLNIPNVVAHLGGYTTMRYNYLKYKEDSAKSEKIAYQQAEDILNFIDKNNIKAKVCIENIMCYGDFPGDMACYGTRLDANNFVASFNHPNFKSTLDICHMMLDVNIDCLSGSGKPMRIADYVTIFAETVGMVHLNNFSGFGLFKEHSLPFTENDRQLLKKILIKFKECNYDCPITSEVNEPGYTEDVAFTNYASQLSLIKDISKEIDLKVEV